jgi:hypothetical protein
MRLREPVNLQHRPSRSNSGSRSPSMFGAMLRRIWALPMSTSEGRFAARDRGPKGRRKHGRGVEET